MSGVGSADTTEGLPVDHGTGPPLQVRGIGDPSSLTNSARQIHTLPAVEESAYLGLAVPAVPAGRPDRGKLAASSPASHGLRVDPKHGRDLGWREEPVVRFDLSSHCSGSSRCYLGDYIVTESDQCWHYSLKSSNHRMSQDPRLCWRSDRQDDKFRRRSQMSFLRTTPCDRRWFTPDGSAPITMRRMRSTRDPYAIAFAHVDRSSRASVAARPSRPDPRRPTLASQSWWPGIARRADRARAASAGRR